MRFLDNVRKIALIGASNNRTKYGNIITRDLLEKNFFLFPVNHHQKEILGLTAFPDLKSLQKAGIIPDLLVYVVPPHQTLISLQEALSLKLIHVWIQPGAGNERVLNFLQDHDFSFIYHECIMVLT